MAVTREERLCDAVPAAADARHQVAWLPGFRRGVLAPGKPLGALLTAWLRTRATAVGPSVAG
jgi:hypothetical protein